AVGLRRFHVTGVQTCALPIFHVDDVVGLITFLSRHPEARGPINATAPQPVTNKEFARPLGRVLGKPAWLPAPAPALRLVLGEMSSEERRGGRVCTARSAPRGL